MKCRYPWLLKSKQSILKLLNPNWIVIKLKGQFNFCSSWHVYIWMCVRWLGEWRFLICGSRFSQTDMQKIQSHLRSTVIRSDHWLCASFLHAHVLLSMYLLYLIWGCVRSEVLCCVLWYLGSGSWVRPSGSLRSRRSEACNYWSPPGPLWGRYGSSDACCSCTDVQEFFYFLFLKREGEHVCSSTCVGMNLSACARQTDCRTIFSWTAWVKQSQWR